MPNTITFACNVQNPNLEGDPAAENFGCGKTFEATVDLGPRDRLCQECTGKHKKTLDKLYKALDSV